MNLSTLVDRPYKLLKSLLLTQTASFTVTLVPCRLLINKNPIANSANFMMVRLFNLESDEVIPSRRTVRIYSAEKQ